jgi:acetoin utilization deacetylase AcuC-like enzyme
MKAYYSDRFILPLPEGHRFPLPKYPSLRQRVTESGLIPYADLVESPAATDEELLRVHTPEYLSKVVNGLLDEKEIRRIGFP